MIPYFQFTTFNLGPVPIQVWGTLVAIGFIAGAMAAAKMAKSRGLLEQHVYDLTGWILIASMIGARLFVVLFYEPAYYLAHPLQAFAIWQGGMSVFGGFAGAVLAAVIYFRVKKIDPWKYSNALIFGLPLGLAIGRIGCFLIHDHPGTATHFFLSVKYPDGVSRHDLGLDESISCFLLFIVFLIMAKKKAPQEWYLPIFCFWYGLVRFLMDFLRTTDARYLGLTPAQYLSILLIGVGVWLVVRMRKTPGRRVRGS